MSQEEKDFSLDIVLSHLNLIDLKDEETENLLIELNFDDIDFNVTQNCRNINNFRAGRSIELTSSVQRLKTKLTSKPINLRIYKNKNEDEGLLGEVSCEWPKTFIDKLEKKDLSFSPYLRICDVNLNGELVGNITLVLMLHCHCMESKIIDSGKPYVDERGNLGEFDEISKVIGRDDMFFVVGSNPDRFGRNAESVDFKVLDSEREKYPYRLNTKPFQSIKGTLVKDCQPIEEPICGLPTKKLKKCKSSQSSHDNCDCHDCDCWQVFDEIKRARNQIDKLKEEYSSSDSSRNEVNDCTIPASRRKSNVPYKERCRCRKLPLSSDSEANKLLDVMEPKLENYLQQNINLSADKNLNIYQKNFPILPTKHCEFCCENLTYDPEKAACKKCGQESKSIPTKDDESIDEFVEKWGKDEKKFIENQGFSKYDHCTCSNNKDQECIYCMINQMRENQTAPNFRHAVKDSEEKDENEVEHVCNEILTKYQSPLDRDSFDQRKRGGGDGPQNIPVLAKMVHWLKGKCLVGDRLKAGSNARTKKIKNNLNRTTQKSTKGLSKLQRIAQVTNQKFSKKQNDGIRRISGKRIKPEKVERSSDGVKNKRYPSQMEHLVRENFISDNEDLNEKVDCVLAGLDPEKEKQIKETMQKLCNFDPESVWTKPPPKPLTKMQYLRNMKRKYGNKYCFPRNAKPPDAFARHRHCLRHQPLVPRNMGWLWTLQTAEVERGWRPGRLRKSIRELMQYFLREFPADNLTTTREIRARRRPRPPPEPEEPLNQKPTLHVRKRNDQYLITMNPLKDARSLETSADPYANTKPIQFRISKDPIEVHRRQVKRYLKQIGFLKCNCGQPVSNCTCRSYMEKERLDSTLESLEALLRVHNLKQIVSLSDTTDSDSQLDMEFTPPAGVVKPHLRKRGRLESQSTQYERSDYTLRHHARNIETIKEERKRKQRENCLGSIKKEDCKPKEQDEPKEVNGTASPTEPTTREKLEPKLKGLSKFLPGDKPSSATRRAQYPPPPILKFAKNPIGSKIQTIPTKLRSHNATNKPRVRGGADMSPVRSHLASKSSPPQSYNRIQQSKENVILSKNPLETPYRVTKPKNHYNKNLHERPPWDNSIYIPPPLRTFENPWNPKQIDRLPTVARPPRRNYLTHSNKNQLKESSAQFNEKPPNASNTENKPKTTEKKSIGNTTKTHINNPTSVFHRSYQNKGSNPLKEFNKQPISVR